MKGRGEQTQDTLDNIPFDSEVGVLGRTALDKLRAIDDAARFGEMVIPPEAKFARAQLAALAHLLRPAMEALKVYTKLSEGAGDSRAHAVLAKLSKTLGTGEEALS